MLYRNTRLRSLSLAACSIAAPLLAQSAITDNMAFGEHIHGTVRDPLGAVVANAHIELISDGHVRTSANSNARGVYDVVATHTGPYIVRATAPSFDATDTPVKVLRLASDMRLDLTLATPTDTQQVSVTATGTATPEAQIGASLTILSTEDLTDKLEVQDPLRLIAGVQITQTGQMGGTSGLNIRGGDTDANKLLIDGVSANQIGGGVEFANLASVGISSIEVLREPNSALYGSDALAGVVALTSTRAALTPLPLFTYAGDGGNFRTYRNEVTGSEVYRQFDLYSAFARVDTRNSLPNSKFHNATYAGNFGYAPNAANDLRFTTRQIAVSGGQPGAIALNGIADDGIEKEQDHYYTGTWDNQATTRWHNLLRYGGIRLNSTYYTGAPTGIPDGFGDYDGAVVTITGANGYSVTGQTAFQFGPATPFVSVTKRDFVYAQTDYRLNPHVVALGGFKYENESGSSGNQGTSPETIQRGNYSYTIQFSGDFFNRLFYSVGTGLEDNGLFGFAGTPRASLAYYLLRPSSNGLFTGTKLHGSFGKGIKEPSIFQQSNSLVSADPTATPLGPETSRTFDGGLDQQLLNGRVRLGVTYFHNEFTNVIQDVPNSALSAFPKVDPAKYPYGVYLNASSFRAQGIEFESEYRINSHLFARGGYTYTDAVVQKSFATAASGTDFPTIAIGAYAPLAGARPFRIAPHTGYFGVNYSRSKFYTSLTGTLVGRRDDSTFASDTSFGNTMLLPNRNLLGAYQRLELNGGYRITPRVSVYTDIQNLLSEHYFEAFGYPSLPLTFRSGIKLNFGGESWKWN
ncbi:iron complex outermembrane recepter protein/vitamin B12 transporter [Granulicella rosea]|uniref:Iron complex outermembrane recepter protein/vitamin B12 transporter n=1 Tax=Granulicella rosea TaxID=474952 RepID=A0A239INI5_9BACT|nr:TonB-dependent receptor [Granulicella rosea]SNS94633.1 iron complex outermembrane recepter protein/vitamin B12 transporter [Granulicella rosea]